MAQAQIQTKALDDVPGFASQQDKPGMQIAPLTPPTPAPQPIDLTSITPAYDPAPLLEGINTIANAQREEIKASADAIAKNTIISQQAYDEQVKQQESVLQSYDKLQRIGRNPLAELFAVFDPSTWNPEQQKIEIEKAQLRSQSATMRAQAQININNQIPALKKTETELAGLGFENQLKYFGAIKDVSQLTNAQMETRLKAVDLTLKLSQEQRQLVQDAAKNLTGDQAKAELKRANAGQGFWADKAGILEDIIQKSDKQDLDAAQIKQNMQNQRFDLAEKQMHSLVQGTDFASGQALIEDALATGKNTINIKGIPVPLGIMITGMEQVRKDTEALTAASLGNSLYGMNEKMQKLTTANSALALRDPKAAQRLQDIARFSQSTDKRDPYQVQRFNSFLDIAQKDTDEAIKRASAVYQTPEAKAAFTEFGETGQFSPNGSLAVTQEALGNTAVVAGSKFPQAWQALNLEYAKRIQDINPTGMPSVNLKGNNAATESARLMAWAFRNPNKKLSDIRAELVQSGTADDQVSAVVNSTFRRDAMKNVLEGLSTAPGVTASTYLNLVRDPRLFTDEQGNVDPAKLTLYLSKQSVLSGGKTDYLQTFIDGLRMYDTNADSMKADPTMTVEDHALLTKMYGSNPRNTVMQSFISIMAQNAQVQNANIQEQIRQDTSGETQRNAYAGVPVEGMDLQALMSSVPSATGIGTAEEIKAIYGTDPRFGIGIAQPSTAKRK